MTAMTELTTAGGAALTSIDVVHREGHIRSFPNKHHSEDDEDRSWRSANAHVVRSLTLVGVVLGGANTALAHNYATSSVHVVIPSQAQEYQAHELARRELEGFRRMDSGWNSVRCGAAILRQLRSSRSADDSTERVLPGSGYRHIYPFAEHYRCP